MGYHDCKPLVTEVPHEQQEEDYMAARRFDTSAAQEAMHLSLQNQIISMLKTKDT